MSDRLDLPMSSEIEHTIETRAHGYASGICLGDANGAECLAFNRFNLTKFGIIFFFGLAEEPVHAVLYTRCDVDILEGCEVRQANLEIMGHSVLELVEKSRLSEFGCLEVDSVLK